MSTQQLSAGQQLPACPPARPPACPLGSWCCLWIRSLNAECEQLLYQSSIYKQYSINRSVFIRIISGRHQSRHRYQRHQQHQHTTTSTTSASERSIRGWSVLHRSSDPIQAGLQRFYQIERAPIPPTPPSHPPRCLHWQHRRGQHRRVHCVCNGGVGPGDQRAGSIGSAGLARAPPGSRWSVTASVTATGNYIRAFWIFDMKNGKFNRRLSLDSIMRRLQFSKNIDKQLNESSLATAVYQPLRRVPDKTDEFLGCITCSVYIIQLKLACV